MLLDIKFLSFRRRILWGWVFSLSIVCFKKGSLCEMVFFALSNLGMDVWDADEDIIPPPHAIEGSVERFPNEDFQG